VNDTEAFDFVASHGAVLAAAKGPAPNMADIIAGEVVRGSWWGHPRGKEIYAILNSLEASPEILVCRALNGKITLIHRRLWPALVRAADRFPIERLARVEQEHTPAGHHVNHDTPFPLWADSQCLSEASAMTEAEAVTALEESRLLP
jgi:hypothetical protein